MKGSVDPVEHSRGGDGGGLLRSLWHFCAVAGLAASLLAGFRPEATAQVIPETRGRPAPQLPPVQPSPSPPSSLTVPLPPQPPEGAPLAQGPRFVLRDVTIVGNTVLDPAAIRGVVEPYLGKPVTTADLEEIRRQLTLLYIRSRLHQLGSGDPGPERRQWRGRFSRRRRSGHRYRGHRHRPLRSGIFPLAPRPRHRDLHSMSRIWGASSRSCCRTRWSSGSISSCCPVSNPAKRGFMPTCSKAAVIR